MKNEGRLLELDCLRGLAALLVVIYHFTMRQPSLAYFFRFGCTGVELFFIISGFVIFLTIKKTRHYGDFIRSRFARLYPAYWLCVTLTTAAVLIWSFIVKAPTSFPGLQDYLINLTMVQHYLNTKDIDGSYWTLICELLFYAFILILFVTKSLDRTNLIGYCVVALCLLYGTILKQKAIAVHDSVNFYFPLVSFFSLFIAGMTFYKIKFEGNKLSLWFLVLFCFLTQIVLFNEIVRTMTQLQYVVILSVIFLLFALYSTDRLGFIINKQLLFLGKISYSLYLIHQFISVELLIPLFSHSSRFKINLWVVDFFIVLPLMLILATLINKYIEAPALNLIKGKRLLKP